MSTKLWRSMKEKSYNHEEQEPILFIFSMMELSIILLAKSTSYLLIMKPAFCIVC